MSEDDEGVEPIETESLIGSLSGDDDEGIPIIETDTEQRGGGGRDEDKHG